MFLVSSMTSFFLFLISCCLYEITVEFILSQDSNEFAYSVSILWIDNIYNEFIYRVNNADFSHGYIENDKTDGNTKTSDKCGISKQP